MFPWVDGFHWSAGHLIFLGAFFSVVILIALTVTRTLKKAANMLSGGRIESIRWHADFTDLPEDAKRCRHELTGELRERFCPNAFACGECQLHPVLEAKRVALPPPPGNAVTVGGVRMPLDRFYHRAHTWARVEQDGSCTIGPDAFLDRILGEPDTLQLPDPGLRLYQSGPACELLKNGRGYRVLSPIGGTVLSTGGTGRNWWIRVRPDVHPEKAPHLLRGAEIKPWIVKEMDRIQLMVAGSDAGLTLADGGELLPELGGKYPDDLMDEVRARLLLCG
jgi:glycine cleavage system H protein